MPQRVVTGRHDERQRPGGCRWAYPRGDDHCARSNGGGWITVWNERFVRHFVKPGEEQVHKLRAKGAVQAIMATGRPLEVDHELIEALRHSGLVTEYLAGVLPATVWRVTPPAGRGRSIAAIFAHMQGVRRTFARMGGARPGPPRLDRRSVTPAEARRAFRQSTDDLARLFESALASRRPRVKGMPRRVIDMLTYLYSTTRITVARSVCWRGTWAMSSVGMTGCGSGDGSPFPRAPARGERGDCHRYSFRCRQRMRSMIVLSSVNTASCDRMELQSIRTLFHGLPFSAQARWR